MSTTIRQVIWDADGVLVDSRELAWRVAEDILAVFGKQVEIGSQSDYRRYFGRSSDGSLVDEEATELLRAFHRLAMRHRAPEVRPFDPVIDVAFRVALPCSVVTAAFAEGVKEALGERAHYFRDIVGRELGRKPEGLMRLLENGPALYVTDTARDVRLCESLDVQVVAVAWGYDEAADLYAFRGCRDRVGESFV